MSPTPRRPRKRPTGSPLSSELSVALAAAVDKKALDVVVLDLRKASAFTDFFMIFTGSNVRQVQAIADAIQAALGKEGTKPAIIEGMSRGEWVLIDYFDFIVHIFTPVTREFYGLEKLWGDAERIDVPA